MRAINRKLVYLGTGLGLAGIGLAFGTRTWPSAPRIREPYLAEAPSNPGALRKHFVGKVHFDVLAKLLADDRRASDDVWLHDLADNAARYQVESASHFLAGRPAPAIALRDHRGRLWNLADNLVNGPVVLVFYLGYSCPACVHDLFELNADLARFQTLQAQVVAVSGDAPEFTAERFANYGSFHFPVLADSDHAVAGAYGVYRPASQATPEELWHATFIVSRGSTVHWAQFGEAPFRNNKALLLEVARLEGRLPATAAKLTPWSQGDMAP